MKNLDKVINFFKNNNINGTFIFYGSVIEGKKSSDIDLIIFLDNINFNKKEIIEKYIDFLKENNIKIDEEIKYKDKLFITKNELENIVNNFPLNIEDFIKPIDLKNDYERIVKRLIVNIFTTKTIIIGDKEYYYKISNIFWNKLISLLEQKKKNHDFEDFKLLFKINKNYKNYFGYSPRIINYLFDRYIFHTTCDFLIKNLKDNKLKYPKKIAVYDLEKTYTYEELDEYSDKIAAELLKYKEKNVIVCYPHNSKLLLIILGIYKAGKTYVPIDYYSSELEQKLIINQIEDYVIIDENFNINKILNYEYKFIKYKYPKIVYIMHTSGTTGKPKGVQITRDNLKYILDGIQDIFPVEHEDCYLFSTRITFDVSITEIFGFLKNAGSVFVYSLKDINFYRDLSNFVNKYKITHIALSPSVFHLLLKNFSDYDFEKMNRNIKYYMIAGEEFKIEILPYIEKNIKNSRVFNVYGPTETTVYATYYEVKDFDYDKVPIGFVFKGVKIKITNDGELLIGGKGVAHGYYNDDEKTKNKFILMNGEKYYKTGDIVKIKDNKLIFYGRKDDQIQINGIRIELGEIRALIKKIIDREDKRDIQVIYYDDKIILFYTGKKIENWFQLLHKKINNYKMPNVFINISNIPINKSGKVDKKYLQKVYLEHKKHLIKKEDNNEIKEKIYKLIYEKIKTEISYDDNIFLNGIDSLDSFEILLNLEKLFNIKIDNVSLYEIPTINLIYKYIIEHKRVEYKKVNFDIKNVNLNNKILTYTYPLYFYARIYNILDFKSIIYDKINLSYLKIDYEELKKRLSKIEVLKTIINLEKNQFEYYKDLDINISKFYSENVYLDLEEKLVELVYNNRKKNSFMYKFIYVYNEKQSVLYYAIDHSIFDESCKNILKKIIVDDKLVPEKLSDYIMELEKNNNESKFSFKNRFHQKVVENSSSKLPDILSKMEDKTIFKEINCDSLNTTDVYIRIIDWLREVFFNEYEIKNCNINLIYNIRKFKNSSYENLIGDIHLGITFPYIEAEDIKKSLYKIVDFYKEEMYNPKFFGYKSFPKTNKIEKEIVSLYDEKVYLNINYVGVKTEKEYEELIKESKTLNKEINKINKNKINILSFLVNNKLVLMISKNILKNISRTVVYED
ncbi:MAG: hypothetical protein PWP46_1776 [Fusobacteriaceae bacterium]|jgi:acyl-coenzyme A synthetase/AMP-(fatty) acid ligase/acyl carrier protein|nr:hypothetical protein [Fusobacteriales bacterium]MDN5304890.1 hypothetical protein [Fusobacteriaceae bacterium]